MTQETLLQIPLAVAVGATALGFALIYFAMGSVAWWASTRWLPRRGWGQPLTTRTLVQGQIKAEIGSSLVSILIFGLYGGLTLWGVQAHWWQLEPQATTAQVAAELVFLVLWNDVHFYVIHRVLHQPWLFKHIHREHHRAIRPTPFSTYSMHPVEAVLLGSVMVLVLPWHSFGLLTVIAFPVVSLALNNLGHWNYELPLRIGSFRLFAASRRHEQHHRQVHGNFGFLFRVLDRALGTELR